MKTLLIPTDFWVNARHAAEYGYHMAKQMKANIMLCNAVIVPAEIPLSSYTVIDLVKKNRRFYVRMSRTTYQKQSEIIIKPVVEQIIRDTDLVLVKVANNRYFKNAIRRWENYKSGIEYRLDLQIRTT